MIYFNKDKQAYGYEIPEYICTVDDNIWAEYASTDKWDIIDGVFTDITNTPEYIAKKAAEEAERISHLKMTKRVCALMLQQLGISYATLKEAIASSEQAQLEWDLCVELERSNPLINVIGATFGLSSKQINQMFKYANGEVNTLEVE